MNSLEDSLRDAYRAAADTIRPETIRPPTFAAEPASRARRGPIARGWAGARGYLRAGRLAGGARRLGVPLAAAAAVAAIVVSATVVVPRVWSGQASGSASSGSAGVSAQAFPGNRMPGGQPPRYFTAIMSVSKSSQPDATSLDVFNPATGRVVGHLARPRPDLYFEAVAALGNDHTFVAAATRGVMPRGTAGCNTWLYRFRVTPQGKPTGLQPLSLREVPGYLELGTLAASANGSVVAYNTTPCAFPDSRAYAGQVGVIHMRSGQLTTWKYRFPASPTSLSLSADGRLLSMVGNPSNGSSESTITLNSEWVLRTSAAAGPLEQHYRRVFGAPHWPIASTLSPAGTVVIAGLPRYLRNQHWQVTLAAYQTATGKVTAIVDVLRVLSSLESADLSPSHSGRYLLLNSWNDFVERIDLATGRISKVPGIQDFRPIQVAW